MVLPRKKFESEAADHCLSCRSILKSGKELSVKKPRGMMLKTEADNKVMPLATCEQPIFKRHARSLRLDSLMILPDRTRIVSARNYMLAAALSGVCLSRRRQPS